MGGHRAPGAGDDVVDGPVNVAAVRADDALLDAIAGGAGKGDRGADYGLGGFGGADDGADDERIAAILAAWRADIEADPMPELVTLDEAAEAIEAGHEAHHRVRSRARRRMPFAVAAAAAVVAVAGMTVAVHGAMPGDTLWGVSKVFFSERAEGVERVQEVRSSIDEANAALKQGDIPAARRALEAANVKLPQVPPQEAAPLRTERDEVESSLAPRSADPTEPPARGSATQAPDTREEPTPGENSEDSPAPQRPGPGTDPSDGSSPLPSPAEPEATAPREATPPPPPPPTTTQGLSSSPSSSTGSN